MILAIKDSRQLKPFSIPISNAKYSPFKDLTDGELIVPEGTISQSMISLRLSKEDYKIFSSVKSLYNPEKFVVAYQDYVSWLIPDSNNCNITRLVILMQVDLGPDIPRYLQVDKQ